MQSIGSKVDSGHGKVQRSLAFAALMILSSILAPVFSITENVDPETSGSVSYTPAPPGPHALSQPNGYVFQAFESGDERGVRVETIEGFTILRANDGGWVYAIQSEDGRIAPSGLRVGSGPASALGVPKHLSNPPRDEPEAIGGTYIPPTGSPLVITIRVEFSDVKIDTASHGDAYFNAMLSDLNSYFYENSYGALDMNFVLASTIYDLGSDTYNLTCNTMAHYGTGDASGASGCPRVLIQHTINVADSSIDFSLYKGVVVIHAGVGDESNGGGDDSSLWSMRRSFSAVNLDGMAITSGTIVPEYESGGIGTTGVVAHELGHDLGLVDLYDTDGTTGGDSLGAGDWDLMGYGGWCGNGNNPCHLSAWSKIGMGWLTPTKVQRNKVAQTLNPVETSQQALKFEITPSEYFLAEYRYDSASGASFDQYLPGSGLVIWHINQSAYANRVSANLKVDVEEADGVQEIELDPTDPSSNTGEPTDPWFSGNPQMPAGGFTSTSSPNSKARDGSITGLRVFSFGAVGGTITFSYEFAPLRVGDMTDPITLGPGAEGYQQFRLYGPYGAQRLCARSWSGSGTSVDLYANRASPASPGAYVDKADTSGTSTETLVVDDADSTPLPTNPGWWFVNLTGSSPESVSLKTELEIATFADTAERFSTGGSLNGWMQETRNETRLTTTYGPWHFSASSSKAGSMSYSTGDAVTKYPYRTDSVLTGPMFNLTSVEAPWLTFWAYYDFQGADIPGGYRLDGFWLEARDASSSTWSLISPVGDYPMTLASGSGGLGNTLDATYGGLPGQKAFTMESGGWAQYKFDLSAYAGGRVLVRFHFWSNPGGWVVGTDDQILYIDQFSVTHRALINEVLASQGTRSEFVEIHNPSSVAIDMDNWKVRDGDGGLDLTIPVALLPLQPGAYLWINLGDVGMNDYDSSDGTATIYAGLSPVLNPADDSIVLIDDRSGHVDFVRFGSSANDAPQFALWTGTATATTTTDQSYGRDKDSNDTDDSSNWENAGGIDAQGPTPGARNFGPAIPELRIIVIIASAAIAIPAILLRRRYRRARSSAA